MEVSSLGWCRRSCGEGGGGVGRWSEEEGGALGEGAEGRIAASARHFRGGMGELGWDGSSAQSSRHGAWSSLRSRNCPGWLLSDTIVTAVVAIRVGVRMDKMLPSVDLEWKIVDITGWTMA